MKFIITRIFLLSLVLTLICTFIVGIAWMFDYKPNNLYLIWKFLGSCLVVSALFQILFGAKIELN